jgi:carbamoyl-phosphate synthase small subunit
MRCLEAALALEDGSIFKGVGFGAEAESSGEVVFNTGMAGYPESITDPSYAGQILVQTYPLIGNYGVPNRRDQYGFPLSQESDKPRIEGYVVSRLSASMSHWSADTPLSDWLARSGVPGITGIDTRMLTKKLRIKGVMLGILKVAEEVDVDELLGRVSDIPDPSKVDLAKTVTTEKLTIYGASGPRIALIDCGVKFGIIRSLLRRGASVARVPCGYTAEQILDLEPSGVLVSNGPGEPKMCIDTIRAVRGLLETDVPMMGICLGNQLQALAAGGDTYKLKFGHRGQNHPCHDLEGGSHIITSQNHGFTVEPKSLDVTGFRVSFVNDNDGTVEGITHESKPFFGVQFHPEASPGPLDAEFLFDRFLKEVKVCHA